MAASHDMTISAEGRPPAGGLEASPEYPASIAGSVASAAAADAEEARQEAGPLPSKRGEIGFREELHAESEDTRSLRSLPARHPADREAPATPGADTAAFDNVPLATDSAQPATAPTPIKTPKLRALAVGGLHATTLLMCALQVVLLGGTIAAWVLLIPRVKHSAVNGVSTLVFVHLSLTVLCLLQLFFLERRVFRLRAERFVHLHPGALLPTALGGPAAGMALAPWARPPLPTYAAALAQAGAGTGDVEDHLIAAPPPPAYGQTRGSTLLLAGYLRASLRAQRPVSAHSAASVRMSYASATGAERAERERRVGEALAVLESGERERAGG